MNEKIVLNNDNRDEIIKLVFSGDLFFGDAENRNQRRWEQDRIQLANFLIAS